MFDPHENHNEAEPVVKYYGLYTPIFYSNSGEPFFLLGPGYCRSLALMGFINFISFGFLVYFKKAGREVHDHYNKLQITTMILLNIIFVLVAFINPGIVTSQIVPSTSDYCEVCQLYKAERQVHCEQCKICITGYVFHCPLLGICIGKYNAIAFYFFVFCFFIWALVELSNFSIVFMMD